MENPREIIDDKYQAFIDNDSIHMNYTKLEYVYKSYIGLLDKVDAVSMLMKERQFLTELHYIGRQAALALVVHALHFFSLLSMSSAM